MNQTPKQKEDIDMMQKRYICNNNDFEKNNLMKDFNRMLYMDHVTACNQNLALLYKLINTNGKVSESKDIRDKSIHNRDVNSVDTIKTDLEPKAMKIFENDLHNVSKNKKITVFSNTKISDKFNGEKKNIQEINNGNSNNKQKSMKKMLKKQRQKEKKLLNQVSLNEESLKTKSDNQIAEEPLITNLTITEFSNDPSSEKVDIKISKNVNTEDRSINEKKVTETMTNMKSLSSDENIFLSIDNNSITNVDDGETNLSTTKLVNCPVENLECENIEKFGENFVNVTYKRHKRTLLPPSGQSIKLSLLHGENAVKLALENNFKQAIVHFTKAVEFDHTNMCHYVNRSFCYLRLKKYKQCLNDAQYAVKNCMAIDILSRAKILEGLAYKNLSNYDDAEIALQESFNLISNEQVRYELMYVRIKRLVHMGYSEKSVILAMLVSKSVSEAQEYLATNTSTSPVSQVTKESNCIDWDELYFSDDCEDMNFELISQISF